MKRFSGLEPVDQVDGMANLIRDHPAVLVTVTFLRPRQATGAELLGPSSQVS